MKLYFRHFKFAMLGVSILCAGLGFAILMWPEYAKKLLCYGFGGVLVLSGILQIASYLICERVGLLRKLLLISGIVGVVAGAWILLSPEMVLTLAVIVLGVVLIYHGAMDVKYGFDIKACGTRGWAPALVFGLFTCAAGVLVLVNPFAAADKLFIAAGVGFLFDGLTGLFTVFTVAHAKSTFERLQAAAPVIELEPGSAEPVAVNGNTADTPAIEAAQEIAEEAAEEADAAGEDAGEAADDGDGE